MAAKSVKSEKETAEAATGNGLTSGDIPIHEIRIWIAQNTKMANRPLL